MKDFQEFLIERVLGKLMNNVKVFQNPSNAELKSMGQHIRGILGNEGEIYCWQDSGGLHQNVATEMNIHYPFVPFTVNVANGIYNVSISTYKNRVNKKQFEDLQNNPLIHRMFGNLPFKIPSYDEWDKENSLF